MAKSDATDGREAQPIEGVISKWGGVIRTICWEAGWIATLFLELGNIDIFLMPSESWLLKQQCSSLASKRIAYPWPWSGESVDLQHDLMVQNVTVNKKNDHRESVFRTLGQEVWLIFRSWQLRRWQCRAWAWAVLDQDLQNRKKLLLEMVSRMAVEWQTLKLGICGGFVLLRWFHIQHHDDLREKTTHVISGRVAWNVVRDGGNGQHNGTHRTSILSILLLSSYQEPFLHWWPSPWFVK